MEDGTNIDPVDLKIQSSAQVKSGYSTKIFVVTIVISLVAGFGGGFLGSTQFNKGNVGLGSSFAGNVSVQEDSAVIDVVKRAGPAVVSVVVSKDLSKIPGYGFSPFDFFFGYGSNNGQPNSTQPDVQEIGAGSGFFVSTDGLVLTNKHVVSDSEASYTVITQDGESYDAEVLATDPVNDLAILKVDAQNMPVLELANSDDLQIGQKVVAIGNSLGQYQNTVTTGVVSGIGRKIVAGSLEGSEQLEGVLQTDAAINPGNSGGPLLNIAGQVIGINTAIDREGQLLGFAIPANDAARALATYKESGKITRPYLGVRYMMISPELAKAEDLPKDYGALIVRGTNRAELAVIPGGPADKAGITENDIVLEVDGKKLDQDHSLVFALKQKKPGDSVKLKLYSKGEEKDVVVVLGESK